jgi:hypothetical protein
MDRGGSPLFFVNVVRQASSACQVKASDKARRNVHLGLEVLL